MKLSTATLGFPRMGPNRELKFALENHWKGLSSESDLLKVALDVEEQGWTIQKGTVDRVTIGDYSLYDAVLTWKEMLGMVSQPFKSMQPGIGRMFAMARGVDGAPALSKSIMCMPFCDGLV
jgi:5-methyltetrahydropteroyltriglutamate--homocysteine methyltransferase